VSGAVALGIVPQPFAAAPPASPSPTATSEATPAPPTQTPTPSAVPSTTPSDSPAAPDPADPSTWLIDFDGIGPITIGGSIAAAEPTVLASYSDATQEACPSIAAFDSDQFTRILAPTAQDLDTVLGVHAVEVSGPVPLKPPFTAEGIGVGSTSDELRAAYPGIPQTGEYGAGIDYGLSDGTGRWIVFNVREDRVSAIGVGTSDRTPTEYCG
jgi:hypothetical protein